MSGVNFNTTKDIIESQICYNRKNFIDNNNKDKNLNFHITAPKNKSLKRSNTA